ncbi:ligase-associated DNA damage response exonuclease [Sphingobacterium sp. SRCM116780]|uniref:ligase-associated DNA damage response exonuclease n=1 Tax=Sphingobacterium sp. SRCM116780 TaxID=2907623 RepID=UPI001F2A781C|nr:ligase-associated DNA damage response exonuclease [Sphingobacterium sp. SRCM116780]UIR57711.1 ligase-associated DNA damage response exonuclease [Sphingobacterium sp. SRCM116780]
MALITFTNRGIYCKQGDFYIDPWLPVDYAVTTHGHADHVRWGNKYYLCHHLTKAIIKCRISEDLVVESLAYGETVVRNGVQISFHPAGHVIGSAQVRLAYKGEVCVISGDYKIEYDGISTAFEPVKCHTFVSESTFGLPIYNWLPQENIIADIKQWATQNQVDHKTTVLIAYSLGKAQRLLQNLAGHMPIYVHNSIARLNEAIEHAGVPLPFHTKITAEMSKDELQGGILIVPPAMQDTKWIKSLHTAAVGVCSGWMQVRSHRRWQSADAGFALSDHADWNGLTSAIRATGAEKVYVTHGFTSVFARYLSEIGISAEAVSTQFGTEEDEGEMAGKEVAS